MFAFIKYLEHIDRSRHLYCHNQYQSYKKDNLQITLLSNRPKLQKVNYLHFLLAHLYEMIFLMEDELLYFFK